jgi:hypothetical protein
MQDAVRYALTPRRPPDPVRRRGGRTTARCRADGVDVLPEIDGGAVGRRVPLHRQYDHAQAGPWRVALRRGQWGPLSDADRGRSPLYEREGDVTQARDLAADRPEVVERLRDELGRLYVPAGTDRGRSGR